MAPWADPAQPFTSLQEGPSCPQVAVSQFFDWVTILCSGILDWNMQVTLPATCLSQWDVLGGGGQVNINWSPHALTLLLLVPDPSVPGFLTRILRDPTFCYRLSLQILDPWDSAYFQATVSGQEVYTNWQIEVKYLYLIEHTYTFRIVCAVCLQIAIQASRGRVTPAMVPPGE